MKLSDAAAKTGSDLALRQRPVNRALVGSFGVFPVGRPRTDRPRASTNRQAIRDPVSATEARLTRALPSGDGLYFIEPMATQHRACLSICADINRIACHSPPARSPPPNGRTLLHNTSNNLYVPRQRFRPVVSKNHHFTEFLKLYLQSFFYPSDQCKHRRVEDVLVLHFSIVASPIFNICGAVQPPC